MNKRAFSLAAIILGAGRSSRMGCPKLLLPWGNTSVLGHLINCWRELKACQIAVVCASDDSKIPAELDRLGFTRQNIIENPNAERGMFSSIACAAQWQAWNSAITHWAIVLGDQPHLQLSTLQKLLNWARQYPDRVCQPTLVGQPKHPVVIPKTCFLQLAKSESSTLKQLLADYSIAGCASEDPGLALDIDRPEDYKKALVLAGLGSPQDTAV